VTVNLRIESSFLFLTVRDDRPLPAESGVNEWGQLLGVRERLLACGGELALEYESGGMRLLAQIPLDGED
jgi:glucose-6-phosphate-specific signal transduction histidine kinase